MNKKVLVSGCFTFFTRGHLHLLKEAEKLGDLYVALNSDDYIIRTKGSAKLVESWETRKNNILETGLVKEVIFFDADTPREIAIELKPDFVVVGNDHNADDMVWASVIEQWGGQIVYIERLRDENGVDISTTNILKNLQNISEKALKSAVDNSIKQIADNFGQKLKDRFNY